MKRSHALSVALLLVFFGPVVAWSCDAPVFRYALERWPADPYQVFVFHRGPMSGAQQETAEWLYERSMAAEAYANFRVEMVDVSQPMANNQRRVWGLATDGEQDRNTHSGGPALPMMALVYPAAAAYSGLIMQTELTRSEGERMLSSPAREKVAQNIIQEGHAIVWVLVESGNKEKDDEALKTIDAAVSELTDTVNRRLKVDFSEISNATERSTGFSVVRVRRDDESEAAFVDMLLHSEAGLEDFATEPMVFPIYGQGRALYALAGTGIRERNLESAVSFVTGVCSCEVKEDNPGVDMLIAAQWDSYPGDPWIDDGIVLATPASMSALQDRGGPAGTAVLDPSDELLRASGSVLGSTFVILAVALAVALVGTVGIFLVRRRKRGHGR